jgi:excisionase family DNA binding protein
LTVKESEERLGLGHTKFAELLNSGEIKSIKIGRARRIAEEWLDEFIAARLEQGGDV